MAHEFVLKDIFRVQKGERLKTFLLFLWIFLFICVYYVLRPIRRGLVLDGLGNENMPFVYIGTALVTGLVVWAYSRFTHLPRRTLIGTIYGIFIANLLMWWQILQQPTAVASGIFWVWLDVFSIMGVTVFWMYANDLFDSSSAKRLFGILAGGGGLGAVLGSSITAALVVQVGTMNMLPVAAGLVALTLVIFLMLENINKDQPCERTAAPNFEDKDLSSIASVFKAISGNRFLLFLTLVVVFERLTPDLVQFLYNEVLKSLATGRDAIAALDANLERWRGLAELGVELFVVSFVLRRFGTTFSLTSSAVAIIASLFLFALTQSPVVLIGIFHVDEAIRHAWFKAAKELTYTVTPRKVLYSVKPVIEMFCYRFARGIAGVLIYAVNTLLGLGTLGVIALGLTAAGVWAYAGWKLSQEYRRLELESILAREQEQQRERQKVLVSA